jgi:XTP/dITP diphosphohydrolase
MEIVFATSNMGKFKEVSNLFAGSQIILKSLADFPGIKDVVEDKETFEGNAQKKAGEIFEQIRIPVIADDSGLMVEHLNGEPGVYSARYAGEQCSYSDNNKKLLKELQNFEKPNKAKFVCWAVYYDGKDFVNAYGEVKGEIIDKLTGAGGFGYDPLFLPDGFTKTMAELTAEEKNKISHRGKAFRELKEKLIQKALL